MEDIYTINKLNVIGGRKPIKIDLQPNDIDLKEGLCLGVWEDRNGSLNKLIVNTVLSLNDAHELHNYLLKYIAEANKQIKQELNG